LAALSPVEWELERRDAAERLTIRVSVLEDMVVKARAPAQNRFEHSNAPRHFPTETGTSSCSNDGSKPIDANDLYEVAKEIIEHPDPMVLVERAIIASGYAGDSTPTELAYLAVTSRLLDRPLNVQFLAQSASGKNFTVDTALQLFP
jgi:hypothetical protein